MEPEDQEIQDQAEETTETSSETNVTNVSITLWLFILAIVILVYPTYLGTNSGGFWASITAGIFYILSAGILLFGLVGVFVVLRDDPELRRFIRELLPLGLPGRDAWQNAGVMSTLLIIAAMLHLFFMTLIGLTGVFAILLKTLILASLIIATLFAAVTVDEFFFQPFRLHLSSSSANIELYKQRIRKLLVGVAGSIGTLVAIIDLFLM